MTDPTVSMEDLAEMIRSIAFEWIGSAQYVRHDFPEAIADKLISSGVVRGQDWRPTQDGKDWVVDESVVGEICRETGIMGGVVRLIVRAYLDRAAPPIQQPDGGGR